MAEWIAECTRQGVRAGEIAVFVHSDAELERGQRAGLSLAPTPRRRKKIGFELTTPACARHPRVHCGSGLGGLGSGAKSTFDQPMTGVAGASRLAPETRLAPFGANGGTKWDNAASKCVLRDARAKPTFLDEESMT